MTAQLPEQERATLLVVVVPVHVWVPVSAGPVTSSLPSDAIVPVKPLKGALVVMAQAFCVTTTVCPTNELTQCAVTVQVPATLGHALPNEAESDPQATMSRLDATKRFT